MHVAILLFDKLDRNLVADFLCSALVIIVILFFSKTLKKFHLGINLFKRMSEQMINTEAKLQAVDHSLNSFVASDSSGLVIMVNQTFEAMFGWSQAEVLGKDFSDFIIPERYRELHKRGMKNYLLTGQSDKVGNDAGIQLTAMKRDGTEFPIRLFLSTWEKEGFMYFSAIIMDKTEQKAIELATERKLELYHEGEVIINGGVWKWYILTDVVIFSPNLYSIFDMEEQPGRKIDFMVCVYRPDRPIVEEALHKAIADALPYDIEYRVPHRQNGLQTIHCKASVERDENFKTITITGVCTVIKTIPYE